MRLLRHKPCTITDAYKLRIFWFFVMLLSGICIYHNFLGSTFLTTVTGGDTPPSNLPYGRYFPFSYKTLWDTKGVLGGIFHFTHHLVIYQQHL